MVELSIGMTPIVELVMQRFTAALVATGMPINISGNIGGFRNVRVGLCWKVGLVEHWSGTFVARSRGRTPIAERMESSIIVVLSGRTLGMRPDWDLGRVGVATLLRHWETRHERRIVIVLAAREVMLHLL